MVTTDVNWWVYVLRSAQGPHYVGCTTDLRRRVRQHNGEIRGGAKCTSSKRPWSVVMVYGPYSSRSEALRAEYALKRGKRGESRTRWTTADSPHCRMTDQSSRLLEEFVGKVLNWVSSDSKVD